jgi:hypothetical protein
MQLRCCGVDEGSEVFEELGINKGALALAVVHVDSSSRLAPRTRRRAGTIHGFIQGVPKKTKKTSLGK